MSKRPKFFCEYCGTEVRQQDRVCRHCGKFFASVKCPSCGFSGDSKLFRDGCPACGYAVFRDGDSTGYGSRRRGRDFSGFSFGEHGDKKKGNGGDPLPWWIYLASVLFLVGAVALILLRR